MAEQESVQGGGGGLDPSPIFVFPAGEGHSEALGPPSGRRRTTGPAGTPRTPSGSPPSRQRVSEDPSLLETPSDIGRSPGNSADASSESGALSAARALGNSAGGQSTGSGDGPSGTSSDTSAITDSLPNIATRLGEVVAGIDEVNTNVAAFGGTVSEVQAGFGKLLAMQETEYSTLKTRHDIDSGNRASNTRFQRAQSARKLTELRRTNEHLVDAQVTLAQQAADIHRAVNTFEAVFGDLAIVVSWVGRTVRRFIDWTFGLSFPILVAAFFAGIMIGIKHREFINSAPVEVASNATSRIAMILESNPGWRGLLNAPRPILENLGNGGVK